MIYARTQLAHFHPPRHQPPHQQWLESLHSAYNMEEHTPKSQMEVLSQEISDDMGCYRIRAGNRIHRLTINCDVYDEDTMCRPYLLIPNLPDFPDAAWTKMHIFREVAGDPSSPISKTISWEVPPAIESTWHPEYIDVLSLRRTKRYGPNVHEVVFNGRPAISKIACWEWEIPRLENETYVYEVITKQAHAHEHADGSPISPAFLGHLTENGRVIGMLLEKVEGVHASLDHLPVCESVLRRVHSLGIVHGDVNRYNFLVCGGGGGSQVRLVDFEHSQVLDDERAAQELESLSSELVEETGRGAPLGLEY